VIITVAILGIVWQSGKTIFTWLLDGVDPGVIEEIRHAASHVPGVEDLAEVRARWLGRELHAEVNVTVDPKLSVAEGNEIARKVNHRLLHQLTYMRGVVVHVDPTQESGEEHHRITAHSHDGLPTHSH
jgi:divalent metal cation (Fe/Co/Zn/Cd) transporter